jgi:type I restriction enzyme R subunit
VNGDEEFRPDITVLINGMPLVFIEVKKPNNTEGILAERNRINIRFQNKKFRRFINMTQFMIFSNNMEYDNEAGIPIQGAFYATVSHKEASFNYFREEDDAISKNLSNLDEETEKVVLIDTNHVPEKDTAEYRTNKSPDKPTNRIITSLLTRKRLALLLRFGLAYIEDFDGISKHIMRYPQLFATLAIEKKINNGIKKGIIWHTQGSGKTALAYFNVAYLTEYFSKRNIVPKFYFITDRIDLSTQAQSEFENRGLYVKLVNSKEDFVKNISSLGAIDNDGGENEITVVNIQKFSEDSKVCKQTDYDVKIQRIYFLDEVHRSYHPHGNFLAHLISSDRDAIFLGLTGTPLIDQTLSRDGQKPVKYDSKGVFGDYIHKYYYDLSIQDGYTLRLIREGIETKYKVQLKEILDQIELIKGSIKRDKLFSHTKYVIALAEYIAADFKKSRTRLDDSIGGMVVCDSGNQAKELFRIFNEQHSDIKTALILYDTDDKKTRKENTKAFKRGEIDILIVERMLLTGFDAKRLKKLYLNRLATGHTLLQALTRVNRPYKDLRYGFVVDFADIQEEFDKTNAAYLKELSGEIGDEYDKYVNLFVRPEDIELQIAEIENRLFRYDVQNAERFSEQINMINDRAEVLDIKRILESVQVLGNLIRLYGYDDLADKLNFVKLKVLLNEVNNRLSLINLKETLENDELNSNILNIAFENIIFDFRKVSEEEMQLGIVNEFKDQMRRTREAMLRNIDPDDPVYVKLLAELNRILKKKNLKEVAETKELQENIDLLRSIYDRVTDCNRRDELLREKYEHDEKFTRVHKRIFENTGWKSEVAINRTLLDIKHRTDRMILDRNALLSNEPYFKQDVQSLVIASLEKNAEFDAEMAKYINQLVVKEYLTEFRGVMA